MTDTRQPVHLIRQGGSFAEALAAMLEEFGRLLGPMASLADDDRSVRLQAEAESLPILVADLIDALVGATQDHEAPPTSVILDGFRTIEGGYRAWATATINIAARPPLTARIIEGPTVNQSEAGWLITAAVIVE
jgi:hypothetical protein